MRADRIRFVRLALSLLVGALWFFISPRVALAYPTGIDSANWGYTGAAGCATAGCHTAGTSGAPTLVSMTNGTTTTNQATATLQAIAGVAATYTLTVNVGTGHNGGGINVTADSGTLAVCAGANCGALQALTGIGQFYPQITHTSEHVGATLTFAFNYTPPTTACSSTLYIFVNGVDTDNNSDNDRPSRFVYTVAANGAGCTDDGNPCTTDVCSNTACTHPAGNAGVVCGLADPTNGCSAAPTCTGSSTVCPTTASKVDGTVCTDGNACTSGDRCLSGVCTPTATTTCPSPDQCHTQGTCNPATGMCSQPTKSDGTACNDSNPCTTTDTCLAGVCTGTSPKQCPPIDDCHVAGTCDSTNGMCTTPLAIDGTVCSDSNACTIADTCAAGVCKSGAPVVCAAPDQCHEAGVCDNGTGICAFAPKADGTACVDADLCVKNDTCNSGVCGNGTKLTCTAMDECHDVGSCDSGTGNCSNPAKADGTACSVGTCQVGVCTPPASSSSSSSSASSSTASSSTGSATGGGGEGGSATGGQGATSSSHGVGGAGAGGDNATGGAGGTGGNVAAGSGGCGCRVAGDDEPGPAKLAFTLIALATVLGSRRRRRAA